MNIRFLTTAVMATLLSAGSAKAISVAEGTEELRVDSGLVLNDVTGTSLELNVGYGLFVMDYIEVGVIGGYNENDFVTDIYGGVFGEYNFETGTELVPFAGLEISLHRAEVDVGFVDDSATALAFGLYGGAKYFLAEDVAVTTRLMFEAATTDIYVDEEEVTDSNFVIDVGLSFFF